MKSLYTKDARYTDVGMQVDREISTAVDPIIRRWVEAGYSPRDIQNVAYGAILDHILTHLMFPF